jgi:UDP-3-O-[3-hydroxymyristoyl] glucosamine N-acyltransferase
VGVGVGVAGGVAVGASVAVGVRVALGDDAALGVDVGVCDAGDVDLRSPVVASAPPVDPPGRSPRHPESATGRPETPRRNQRLEGIP